MIFLVFNFIGFKSYVILADVVWFDVLGVFPCGCRSEDVEVRLYGGLSGYKVMS